MSNVRWLLGVLKEVRWAFTLCVVTWIIEAAFSIAITGAQKWVIDDVFDAGNFGLLLPVVGAYVAAVLLFNLFHLIAYMYRTENQLNVQRVVVGAVMESVYRMPVSRYPNGHLASRRGRRRWGFGSHPQGRQAEQKRLPMLRILTRRPGPVSPASASNLAPQLLHPFTIAFETEGRNSPFGYPAVSALCESGAPLPFRPGDFLE